MKPQVRGYTHHPLHKKTVCVELGGAQRKGDPRQSQYLLGCRFGIRMYPVPQMRILYKVLRRDVIDLKSRGCHKLNGGNTGVTM